MVLMVAHVVIFAISFTLLAMNVRIFSILKVHTYFNYYKLNNLYCIIEREIPRDVFIKYRNENMRKNYIDEIALVDPN
jgi:hypothetical protein